MTWNIDFITYEDFKEHVRNTIVKYGEKLAAFNLEKLNSNIVDPIKLIFDLYVYESDWQNLIEKEIFRQRDKSNTNEIGYFHQGIFEYITGCSTPKTGWDIICKPEDGYVLDDGNKIRTVYVELKNKHNTMNSSSAAATYKKMQQQLIQDDSCACFLVEVIAKRSQDTKWGRTVDGIFYSNNRIRRVSIDKFYEIVTGQSDAFYQVCKALPEVINTVLSEQDSTIKAPQDTAYYELLAISQNTNVGSNKDNILAAIYSLAFSSYLGFASEDDK